LFGASHARCSRGLVDRSFSSRPIEKSRQSVIRPWLDAGAVRRRGVRFSLLCTLVLAASAKATTGASDGPYAEDFDFYWTIDDNFA
jgi:hypothetical protein